MDYFATPKNQKSDDLEVTGISRSGRVRKKSSKLLDFESPDDFTEHKLKKQKAQQHAHAQQLLEKYEQQLQNQKSQNTNSVQQTNFVYQNNTTPQQRKYPGSPVVRFKQEPKDYESPMVHYKQEPRVHGSPMVHFKEEPREESESEDEEESSESESEEANGIENDDESSDESVSGEEIDPLMLDDPEPEAEETTGFTKLEPPEQTDLPSQTKNSLYMLEKYKKKLVIKDGKVINKPMAKPQRKDKGKTRFTAYMLWAKEARQQVVEHHPNLDFATISKKLGEMWSMVPTLEKYNWSKRAKRLALKPPTPSLKDNSMPPPNVRKFINKTNMTPPKKVVQLGTPVIGKEVPVSPPSNKAGPNEAFLGTGMYKVTGTKPIDIAAHFTLLGESLTIIGKRLKEHEGQITVSGSLPLLLDSLLCVLGPLLCLTQQLPQMNGAEPEKLAGILENVAYIMPGL